MVDRAKFTKFQFFKLGRDMMTDENQETKFLNLGRKTCISVISRESTWGKELYRSTEVENWLYSSSFPDVILLVYCLLQ